MMPSVKLVNGLSALARPHQEVSPGQVQLGGAATICPTALVHMKLTDWAAAIEATSVQPVVIEVSVRTVPTAPAAVSEPR
jgi:hypothetical protein